MWGCMCSDGEKYIDLYEIDTSALRRLEGCVVVARHGEKWIRDKRCDGRCGVRD